jgi:Mn-dependent DtxR family transcriptional regulator
MACGINSQFAVSLSHQPKFHDFRSRVSIQERNLSTVELKEDNPDAVEHVLRHIYKIAVSPPPDSQLDTQSTWRYWLDVYVATDKYLESGLKQTAFSQVRALTQLRNTVEVIFGFILTLSTEMAHDEACSDLKSELFRNHLRALLQHEPFCRHVEKDTEIMWEIIERLNAKITHASADPNTRQITQVK